MKQITVGVRELKSQLSRYLHEVKAGGATLVITERGTPVGRLVPVSPSLEERLEELVATHQVAWSGRKLKPEPPRVRLRGAKSVAEMLIEDRE
jgi:prevent-host-death family protein